jgi:hypothetical protein
VSLYDVLNFNACPFILACSQIGQIYQQIQSGIIPREDAWPIISGNIADLRTQCDILGLDATRAQIIRIQKMLESTNATSHMFATALMELNSRLIDELSARFLYCLDANRASYVTSNRFSEAAMTRFPDAIADMDERLGVTRLIAQRPQSST